MRKIFFSIIGLFALASCQNELYSDASEDFKADQGVYFVNKGMMQSFIQENTDVSLTNVKIALSQKTSSEVNVAVEYGNKVQLDEYNKVNGTNYILLPKEMYEAKSSILFEPKFTSTYLPINLKNIKFSMKGTYALPIKIKGGDVNVIGGQDESLLVFEQKIITKSVHFKGSGAESADMFPNDFSVDKWTFEVMVNRSSYVSNNRAIGGTKTVPGSSALDEIYTRFGDVTINPNQFQIKTGGSQIDVAADKFSAQPNVWYMISMVYDGKNTSIYVDGVLVAEREIRDGKYGLTGLWLSGSNELIREVRFWKTARTAKEISDNVWKMVNPDDDSLLLYYPLNGKKNDRETGQIVEDETQLWDWSKNQKHLNKPTNAYFDDNDGKLFEFPPQI